MEQYLYLHLHSTMFLLKPLTASSVPNQSLKFTFHNVSIKTLKCASGSSRRAWFTFHNVSIKTGRLWCFQTNIDSFTFHNVSIKTSGVHVCCTVFIWHLHSTMFLLKQKFGEDKGVYFLHLHSTMFLLKLILLCRLDSMLSHLHSTMFLLKRGPAGSSPSLQNIYIPQCFY